MKAASLGECWVLAMGIEPIMFVTIADGKINLAVIVIAIFGRDDDRLNEGLLIGIYVGAFGSISVLFVLRYLGLF
jgi:hypothetical protein